MKMIRIVSIVFVSICFLSGCVGTLVTSTIKIAQSEVASSKASSLSRKTPTITGDSSQYARYYLYRDGSFFGSALSYIVYDNNEFIGLVKIKTFEKVDLVLPGDHVFTSKIDGKQAIKFHFDSGKTYFIQALASTGVSKGVLQLMTHEMVRKELEKGNFFSKEFLKTGLKVEDISF